MSDIYAQWTTECPRCHNRDCLTVFEVTLQQTGEVIHQENPLCPDGFKVDANDDDCSTNDEKIRCEKCGQVFGLDDLALEPRAIHVDEAKYGAKPDGAKY